MSTLMVGKQAISPPVLLSPLAGITDLPYRNLVSSFGAGLVVSEMVASHEIMQKGKDARARAELGFNVDGTSVQIAGRDAFWMSECAKLIEGNGAKIIDINMGCPAKSVVNGASGSALMRTPDLALKLIEAVVNAVDIPVTLKTRLGWDHNDLNAADLSSSAEKIGIQMITIHGRTRCQFYKGDADWRKIREVKEAVNIPVIANGDIIDTPTAKLAMKQSKADGVMIGRGAQGKPWLLSQIASEIFNTKPPEIPSGNKLLEMISNHYLEMLNFYGEQHGNKVARKHLGWYMDYIGVNPIDRRALQTETDPQKVLSMISSLSATEDNPCQ
jgi:nifR3 family TIM-barrel protein